MRWATRTSCASGTTFPKSTSTPTAWNAIGNSTAPGRRRCSACGRPVTGNVSAACALGAAAGSPLVVYFLASHTAPTFIENPRQVSAYNYPAQYGPQPGVLPRRVLHEPGGMTLFISGTASIVGHQTFTPAIRPRRPARHHQHRGASRGGQPGDGQRRVHARDAGLQSLRATPADLPVIQAELARPSARPPRGLPAGGHLPARSGRRDRSDGHGGSLKAHDI